jgi:gliding motility-associated-like protein
VTVNQLAPITGTTTICAGQIAGLSDATPGGTWSSSNVGVATIGVNTGVIGGVAAGNSTATYTTLTGCTTTALITVNLLAPITGATPICQGVTLVLADAATGGTWSSINTGIATIDAAGTVTGVSGGTTTISYITPLGCSAATQLTVYPLPNISATSFTNPTTCGGTDGTITLSGLTIGSTYLTAYDFNGTSQPGPTTVAVAPGNVILPNLSAGTYSNIYVNDQATTCPSNIVGPITLTDPLPPPIPTITSNGPICIGQTLQLFSTDDVQGGTYMWNGPNGFVSNIQNPEILYADINASGVYTVTYTLLNCPSLGSANVVVLPALVMTNITPTQTIPYGKTVQLNADGALYYWWQPNDGSIDNPNINNPIAAPRDSTVYTVIGTNLAGCKDTATIIINVDNSMVDIAPSGFTPNGDGLNDVFKITNLKFQKLVDFSVFNRWGILVYHNTYDPKQGWDGTYNGVPQDAGTYNYNILVITPEGVLRNYKGDVTLIR